jgi:hypothetical protein
MWEEYSSCCKGIEKRYCIIDFANMENYKMQGRGEENTIVPYFKAREMQYLFFLNCIITKKIWECVLCKK